MDSRDGVRGWQARPRDRRSPAPGTADGRRAVTTAPSTIGGTCTKCGLPNIEHGGGLLPQILLSGSQDHLGRGGMTHRHEPHGRAGPAPSWLLRKPPKPSAQPTCRPRKTLPASCGSAWQRLRELGWRESCATARPARRYASSNLAAAASTRASAWTLAVERLVDRRRLAEQPVPVQNPSPTGTQHEHLDLPWDYCAARATGAQSATGGARVTSN